MKVGDLIYNHIHDIRGLLIKWYGSQSSGTVQCWWVLYADGSLDIVSNTEAAVINESR